MTLPASKDSGDSDIHGKLDQKSPTSTGAFLFLTGTCIDWIFMIEWWRNSNTMETKHIHVRVDLLEKAKEAMGFKRISNKAITEYALEELIERKLNE